MQISNMEHLRFRKYENPEEKFTSGSMTISFFQSPIYSRYKISWEALQ